MYDEMTKPFLSIYDSKILAYTSTPTLKTLYITHRKENLQLIAHLNNGIY